MKLYYLNRILINIPSTIITFKSNHNVIFKLNNNIDNKDLLWNVENINLIKFNIIKNNITIADDYIYKYHLIKHDNIYKLSKTKFIINTYSKNLNSCWFINSL